MVHSNIKKEIAICALKTPRCQAARHPPLKVRQTATDWNVYFVSRRNSDNIFNLASLDNDMTNWKSHTSNVAVTDGLIFSVSWFLTFYNKQPKEKMKHDTLKIREERETNFLAN